MFPVITFGMKTKKKEGLAGIRTHNLGIWNYVDKPHNYTGKSEVFSRFYSNSMNTFISVTARNKPIVHDPKREKNI